MKNVNKIIIMKYLYLKRIYVYGKKLHERIRKYTIITKSC